MIATDADAIIFGEGINDGFGTSVPSAGDVNGDGIDDVIVGADQLFNDGSGKAYVFYGPLAGSIPAANAGAILIGEVAQDLFGGSVASAGDFNGDGFDDVLVGASDNGSGGIRSGRAYTFFGPLTGTIAAANADFVVAGAAGDELGLSVAGGDLNGDGASDLIVGAPRFTHGDPGYAGSSSALRKTRRARDRTTRSADHDSADGREFSLRPRCDQRKRRDANHGYLGVTHWTWHESHPGVVLAHSGAGREVPPSFTSGSPGACKRARVPSPEILARSPPPRSGTGSRSRNSERSGNCRISNSGKSFLAS